MNPQPKRSIKISPGKLSVQLFVDFRCLDCGHEQRPKKKDEIFHSQKYEHEANVKSVVYI